MQPDIILKFGEGSGTEVFLDNAVLADDEGPNSSNPVLGRRSYHSKAANRHSLGRRPIGRGSVRERALVNTPHP